MSTDVESATTRPRRPRWIEDAERLDLAIYAAIARTPTPALDVAMSRLSRAADYSRLSMASAALLALAGRTDRPARGRPRARLGRRHRRPWSTSPSSRSRGGDAPTGSRATSRSRATCGCRRSRSFPSGHSAAAFAFATGVGHVSPAAAVPLRALAALVAYSRVHTGVHYPGDVLAGAPDRHHAGAAHDAHARPPRGRRASRSRLRVHGLVHGTLLSGGMTLWRRSSQPPRTGSSPRWYEFHANWAMARRLRRGWIVTDGDTGAVRDRARQRRERHHGDC